MNWTRWSQASGAKCCPSSPWPCPIHPSIWNMHGIFSPSKSPGRCVVLLEIISPSFGELDFWLVHRSFSNTKNIIWDNVNFCIVHCRQFSVTKTTCLTNPLSSQINEQEVALRLLDEEHPCKKIPLVLSPLKLIFPQLLQSQVYIQSATWFQHFWCVEAQWLHFTSTFSVCVIHLRHRLGLS